MRNPDFIATDESDDDMTDMDDDLHLANVDVDKTTPGCQAPQVATGKQLASQPSAQAAANASDQLAAFETITQGIVQGLQDVRGISCAILDSYVQTHYPGVKKALLTPSAAFTGSINRLNTSGFIQVASGPAPLGFAKMRYEPTKKAGVAPAREIAKIVAWVDKLASKPKGKEPDPKETKWRQRAADAIVLHCMHDLLDWGGVHTNVLKQALKKLDRKRQVHRCLSLNMKTIDCVISDLVQRGALERGGASLASKAQHENPEACNVKLRCMHPVSLSELLTAHSVFDLDLPDHVASAALDQPESNGHPNGHPNGHSTHPELAQTEPSLGKTDLHTSASLGAVTGAAAPAYATQMDAPNCDFDASATAKAATAAAAVAAEQNMAGDATAVDTSSLTRDEPNSQHSLDAVVTKKTKTDGSDPALTGLLLAVEEDRGPALFLPSRLSVPEPPPHYVVATPAAALSSGQALHPGTIGGKGPPATLTHPSCHTQPQTPPAAGSVVVATPAGQVPSTASAALVKPPNAPIPGLARPNQGDQPQQIQLAALAAGPTKLNSRIEAQPGQPSSMHQDHGLQQSWGISESNPGSWQQPEEFPQQPQGSWQQPQSGNTQNHFQDPAHNLPHQQPSSADSPRSHPAYANGLGQHPGQPDRHQAGPPNGDLHQQHVVAQQQYGNEQQVIGQPDNGNGQHPNGSGQHAHDSGQHANLNGQYADADWQQSGHDQLEQQQHAGRSRSKAMPQQQSASKSRLHSELMQFSALASPTEAEQQAVSDAVEAVTNVAKAIWPQSRTVLFGSQATTLALPGSDLDIVILGVSENITNAASGFTKMQRDFLGELLEDLLEAFKTINLLRGKAKIIDARVPIIKCTLDFGSGLAADISLGAVNGAAAVQYVCQMVAAAPPLRVLVLVVKALLKETMLNEVFTGGLSSYSIVNMVMTHLLCMGYKLPAGTGPGFWGSLVPAPEQPEEDAGNLLTSFLERFGGGFDYSRHAVSVGQGGVVEKKREWKQAERPWLLAVEDPQQLGKDIGSGSFNIRNVQQLFAAAASTLRDCPHHQTEQDQWAAVQADGASSSAAVESFQERFPLLSELIVVETAVGRDRPAAKKRQQQAKQAPHQTKLSVLPTHKRLKHHLSLSPPAAPVKPSFHVGKTGRKPPVSLQVAQGESKRQKKKGKAKKARDKARAHLHRPQTRSQDASPVALPSDNGGNSMQVDASPSMLRSIQDCSDLVVAGSFAAIYMLRHIYQASRQEIVSWL
ncbi:hypothetical protein WJX82_002262 [Trebouxia sp. C0006]